MGSGGRIRLSWHSPTLVAGLIKTLATLCSEALQNSSTKSLMRGQCTDLVSMLKMKRIILASYIIKTEEWNLPTNLSPVKMHSKLLEYDILLPT